MTVIAGGKIKCTYLVILSAAKYLRLQTRRAFKHIEADFFAMLKMNKLRHEFHHADIILHRQRHFLNQVFF
jgi:hypothetical protein